MPFTFKRIADAGRYDGLMAGVFHISEEEAARDLKALFKYVRAGDDAVVEFAGERVSVTRLDQANESEILGDEDRWTTNQQTLERLLATSPEASSVTSASMPGRTASEIIERLAAWQAKHGKITLDEEFVSDMEEIHR